MKYVLETSWNNLPTKTFKTKVAAVLGVKGYAEKVFGKKLTIKRISDTLWLAVNKTGFGQAIRLEEIK